MTRQSLGTLTAIVLLAGLAVVAIGRASAVATEERVWAQAKDSLAYLASVEIAPLRKEKEAAEARAREAERRLSVERRKSTIVLQTTGAAMDAIRGDTATTNLATVSSSLVVALASYDTLATQFHAYLQADSSAHVLIAAERASALRLIAAGDSALAAMTQARDAWRGAATCKVRLLVATVGCPTRVQTFVGGAVVTLGVMVALK